MIGVFDEKVFSGAAILVALTACGNKSNSNGTSIGKDAPAATSDYSCMGFSTLDSTVQPSTTNWYEVFDFKASETSVSKNVGVTTGDGYVITVSRETNSEGARIDLSVFNLVTKAVSVAQVDEGAKNPMISISPDGKFQIAIVCRKI